MLPIQHLQGREDQDLAESYQQRQVVEEVTLRYSEEYPPHQLGPQSDEPHSEQCGLHLQNFCLHFRTLQSQVRDVYRVCVGYQHHEDDN